MRRRFWQRAALVAAVALAACEDGLPTSVDGDLIPLQPVTVDLRIPWSEFASGLSVWGGYGAPWQLGHGVLANDFEGTLDARTLVRFTNVPRVASVRDTTGTVRPDSTLAFVGGGLLLRFDTLASTNDGAVRLAAARTLHRWDAGSATWELAVDTFGVTDPWPVAGGGPIEPLGEAVWDPADGDSVVIALDSAQVAALIDTAAAASTGIRLSVASSGVRLQVNAVTLRLDARPSINPDTLVPLVATGRELTFIYTPFPEPPPDGIRVGGVPAWRTTLQVSAPRFLNGPAALCSAVGCPLKLTPERISHAELVLTTRTPPAGFSPTDTVRLDVRPVLVPERLPKSPLGGSLLVTPSAPLLTGLLIPPEAFAAGGRTVSVPITPFVRGLVSDPVEGEDPAPSTLALLSVFEPMSISFASFVGPGGEGEPYLRLVVTAVDAVGLP